MYIYVRFYLFTSKVITHLIARTPSLPHALTHSLTSFAFYTGANWFIQKAAGMARPDLLIEQNGDHFIIKLISTMAKREEDFTVGTEFEKEQMDGNMYMV